jgi:hypothetical protein
MREETNAFEGNSVVLERPDDLADLSPSLSRAIPRGVREVFSNYPSSFRSLAAESDFSPLKRWLQKMAKTGRCELAIHCPGPRAASVHPGPEVFLEVGAEEYPILLSGGLPRIPKRCPERLSEVLRLVGVIRMQYGASGGLIHPSQQRPLPGLLKELKGYTTVEPEQALPGWNQARSVKAMYATLVKAGISQSFEEFAKGFQGARQSLAAEVEETPMPAGAKTYYAFYEDASGSYLATNRQGETWHFPMTGGDSVAGPPLDSWLTEFLDPGPFGPGWS